jgi:hypothetical protein
MLRIVFLIASLLLSVFASAQKSILTGKVINDKNEPVTGASVTLTGRAGVSTNIEGRFSIQILTSGTYDLEVSAVGYTNKIISGIAAGNAVKDELVISLETAVRQQEAVIIRTSSRKKESTTALLNFQRNNAAMSSGLAADFIRRTPDRNTGEVLKRVSGTSIQDNKYVIIRGLSDRYNQALINDAVMPSSEPDKKAFSFDIIPSLMIDNVIINKTATPDLPGEFAGGLVQVNTKDIPAANSLSVGISSGYNSQSTFRDFTSNKRNKYDWIGFDDGSRGLPAGLPSTAGYRVLSDQQKMNATQTFRGDVYSETVQKATPISTINLAWSQVKRFDNNASFGSVIAIYHRRAMIVLDDVERGRYEQDRNPIFTGSEVQNKFSVNAGALANFSYVNGRNKISFRNLFNQLFEDNYTNRSLQNTGRLQDVSLRSSFLNQRSLYSGQLEGEHSLSNSGIKFRWNGNFSYNNKQQPDFRTAQFVRPFSDPNGSFEIDEDDSRRFFSSLRDFAYGGHASLVLPFKFLGNRQTLKLGGGTLLRYRDFNARVFRYRPASASSDLHLPFDQAFQRSNIKSDGLFLEEQTQNTDQYIGASALNNGFIMLDNKLGDNLRVIWGVRAEYFDQFLTSRDLSLKRVIVKNEKLDLLPSVNISYSVNDKQQLRASVSQTVARPEFREIAPFQFFDYEAIWGIGGNTELKRTRINNFDLRYEYYPKAGEILSAGLLVKKFTDPIELRMDGGSNSDRWLFSYENAEKAMLYGAEIEIRKDLSFISQGLKNITAIGNFTYLASKLSLATEQSSGERIEVDRPLFGQSPYLLNAGLQFSNNGWNATALYNRIGPRLALVGDPKGAGFYDIYEKPRNLVDLQLSKRFLNQKAEFKITVSDLLNDPFVFYDNFSGSPGYDPSKGDRTNYGYTQGTTITVGFTYDLDLKK